MPATTWRLRQPTQGVNFGGDDHSNVAISSTVAGIEGEPSFTCVIWWDSDGLTPSDLTQKSRGVNYGSEGSNEGGFILGINSDGSIRSYVQDDGGNWQHLGDGGQYADGEIHALALAYDDTAGDMYTLADGAETARQPAVYDPVPPGDPGISIGNRLDQANEAHAGTIHKVIVYAEALTASQFSTVYTEGEEAIAPDPVARWRLDERSGSTLVEDVNGNDATITGSVTREPTPRTAPVDLLDIDERLIDVPECTDAYNRFARRAVAELDDPDATIPTEYPRPTPIELEVKRDIDPSFSRRFGGYVAATHRKGDSTELELLAHDQWIKRADPVFRSVTDTAISTVVSDLITDKTPLTIDEITVVNDRTITRDWSGEQLDNVLEELAAISAGEEFGATDGAGFFFRPRETNSSPRNFPAGEYFEAEFTEDGKQEVNRVTIYYGGTGGSAIQVNDPESQKALQNELGTARPVVISAPAKSYPEISNEEAAERKGNQILNDRSEILTGELATWEAFDVRPGDVASVTVPDQGIAGSFRVAEISYSWREDETRIKLAENSDGVVDTLVALSDEINRIDSRAANQDATITRFVNLAAEFEIDLELEAYRIPVPADQFRFGDHKGGFGHPDIGGGKLGDQSGDEEKVI